MSLLEDDDVANGVDNLVSLCLYEFDLAKCLPVEFGLLGGVVAHFSKYYIECQLIPC